MAHYDGYLSGRITSDLKNYKKRFAKWHAFVLANYEVVNLFNPAKTKLKKEFPAWEDYLAIDIPIICACSIIFMMPLWWISKGARFEHYNAKKLKKRIIYLKNKQLTKYWK